MSITMSLLAARQNAAQPTVVMWSGAEATATGLVLVVARRRLDPQELEEALGGGHEQAQCVRFPTSTGAVQDDVTPAGEPRYYGVLAALPDGSYKPARFRAGAMRELPEGTVRLSALGGQPFAAAATAELPAAPSAPIAPAPVPGSTAARGPFAPSAPAPEPMEARRQAQAQAPQQAPAPAATDPMEARRQAQRRAQQVAGGGAVEPSRAAAPVETVAPPGDFPIERFGVRMIGATQSWDGLRIEWEAEGKPAAAYELFIADHPLAPEEVGEAIGGEAGSGVLVRAFPRSVKGVIDNVTPREQRAYYGVVARAERGRREVVGCVAQGVDQGGSRELPFFDAKRLDDVRSHANGQLREARVQLMIFQEEGDVGAWREALRLVQDALAIHPQLPAAAALEAEIRAARTG